MALTILNAPVTYASSSNDNFFLVYEPIKAIDPVTYPNYSYVADIYVDGDFVARLKSNPDPINKFGLFNISSYVRSYISDINTTRVQQQVSLDDTPVRISYQVKFGEEYSDTTYINLVTDSARYMYNSYSNIPYTSNACVNNVLNKVASNRPLKITIDDSSDISAHLFPVYISSTGISSAQLKAYSNGSIIASGTYTLTKDEDNIQNFNLSRYGINADLLLDETDNVEYITFKVNNVTYQINYDCHPKYESKTISFLNKYGAYESFDFMLVNKKSIEIERKNYMASPYVMAASSISYVQSGNYVGGNKTYYTSSKQKLKLTTDYISDDEYIWLGEMLMSTDVKILEKETGYWIPIQITNTNYEYKQFVSDSLSTIQLEVEYAPLNSQFR